MNYIKHLTGFFDKVANDKLLNPTHVSLYISLFQFWNYNRFKNPISISRDEVMRISKISSKATYHKCLKALHSQGYINYEPSYNPFKGSHVYLFNFSDDLKPLSKSERNSSPNFEPVGKQVADKSQAGTETSPELVGEQAVVPSINNINITNNPNIENGLNGQAPENKNENSDFDFKNGNTEEKEKSSAQKEMPDRILDEKGEVSSPAFADYSAERTETSRQKEAVQHIREVFTRSPEKPPEANPEKNPAIPLLDEVLAYFREQDFPELEANKFFNYFQSIGWLVGGKTPMADWPAAARNWMLNAPKYVTNEITDRTKHLDNSSGKDYSEPL